MKISPKTISLLKNFSSVNPSICVRAGSKLKTVSPQNNIMAEADVEEAFPNQFAIYDLSQFLGAISLFDDPSFEFSGDFVDITQDKRRVRFAYAAENMVKAPPEKKIALPSVDVTFELSEKQLAEILKAASVLGVPEIIVRSDGDGGNTTLVVTENKNKSSNSYNVEVAHQSDDAFNIVFRSEYFKMLPSDYTVEVCSKGISKFTSSKLGVEYFLTSETSSVFGKKKS